MPSMYYLRTLDGLEVDLVVEIDGKLNLFEIKSSMTIVPNHASSLIRVKRDIGNIIDKAAVISCTKDSFMLNNDIANYSWKDIFSA